MKEITVARSSLGSAIIANKVRHTEKIFISECTRLKIKQSSRALELLVAGIKTVTDKVVL